VRPESIERLDNPVELDQEISLGDDQARYVTQNDLGQNQNGTGQRAPAPGSVPKPWTGERRQSRAGWKNSRTIFIQVIASFH